MKDYYTRNSVNSMDVNKYRIRFRGGVTGDETQGRILGWHYIWVKNYNFEIFCKKLKKNQQELKILNSRWSYKMWDMWCCTSGHGSH